MKQKYTGYERDAETSLNYAEARYHSDQQGRFTSVDPLSSSAKLTDPQSFNRYSYVGNNPVNFSDPSGMSARPGFYNIHSTNALIAEDHANNSELAEAEAAYETNLAATIEAAREADSINEGLRSGAISSAQAVAMAANNSMLGAVIQTGSLQENNINFTDLWDSHPGGVKPCKDKDGRPTYEDQCAIRMSIALAGAGIDMSKYPGRTCGIKGHPVHAVSAQELANWLTKILGPPHKESAMHGCLDYKSLTGIIFIKSFQGTANPDQRFNHMDVWDGRRQEPMKHGDKQWLLTAKDIWFWEIK